MITDKDTCSRKEEWLVASILTHLDGAWGPHLSTALAYYREWENPVASRLAKAILDSVENLTKAHVSIHLAPSDAMWLLHPTFRDGLPLDLADWEAEGLLPRYETKRQVRELAERLYLAKKVL